MDSNRQNPDDLRKQFLDAEAKKKLEFNKKLQEARKAGLVNEVTKRELDVLNQQLAFLKGRLDETKVIYRTMEAESVRATRTIQDQLSKSGSVRKRLETDKEKNLQQISSIENEIKKLNADIEKEKSLITERGKKFVELEKKSIILKNANERKNREQKETVTRLGSIYERVKKDSQQLQNIVVVLADKRKNNKLETEKLILNVKTLEKKIAELQKELQGQKKKLDDLQAQSKIIELDFGKNQKSLTDKQKEEVTMQKSYQKESSSADSSSQSTPDELKQAEMEMKKIKEEDAKSRSALSVLEKKRNDLRISDEREKQKQKSVVSGFTAVKEDERRETEQDKAALDNFVKRKENAKADIERFTREIEILETKIRSTQNKIKK